MLVHCVSDCAGQKLLSEKGERTGWSTPFWFTFHENLYKCSQIWTNIKSICISLYKLAFYLLFLQIFRYLYKFVNIFTNVDNNYPPRGVLQPTYRWQAVYLWPNIIQKIDKVLSPFKQLITFRDLVFFIVNSLAPCVYNEKAVNSLLGVSAIKIYKQTESRLCDDIHRHVLETKFRKSCLQWPTEEGLRKLIWN